MMKDINFEITINTNKQIGTEKSQDTSITGFNVKEVLTLLKHFLPSQTPIKDFIHHNTLHAFQDLKFYDGIFKASAFFGYQVTLELCDFRKLYQTGRIRKDVLDYVISKNKGIESIEHWKNKLLSKSYDESNVSMIGRLRSDWRIRYRVDMDSLVQPLLFRVVCSYLDQGIAYSKFPVDNLGFLESVRQLEKNSYTGFFRTKRAKQMLLNDHCDISEILNLLVGDESYYEQYLFDQQFSHQGWSGMVSTIEDQPETLLDSRPISMRDFIVFELLLEIDALDFYYGENWAPLCQGIKIPPLSFKTNYLLTELNEVFMLWQDAFEWSYYDEVLAAISTDKGCNPKVSGPKTFQSMFCIDERECSLRRYIESSDPDCETFGTPGFFGVEFYFQSESAKFYSKLCPAPVTPKFLIKELDVNKKREHEILYSRYSNRFFTGFLFTLTIGFSSAIKLFKNLFMPAMSPAISNAFSHMNRHSSLSVENQGADQSENGLQIGFMVEEMSDRVEGLLKSIGLTKSFADIVYVIAHGSSSANNPHHSAHDCGACSGKPGSVNARVFASMANNIKVREILMERGMTIPASTQFVAALHDTSADEIEFYDLGELNDSNTTGHRRNHNIFEVALNANAKERSRRFMSINTKSDFNTVRKAIKDRSVSLFEPRPELGHGTNSLCIVGRRDLTKDLFLDRRAFLNSYDYETDLDGNMLSGIMKPLGPVCGGINLEYYFSRVDNCKLGAGTKLPHNIMGLIGVANSCDGDLRPGLPLQMIEVHDPVRLLVIVEHFPEVVLKTIKANEDMYNWYKNEWIHLMVMNPETKVFYYFKNEEFLIYLPLLKDVNRINNMTKLIESSVKMETNYIVDATKENLPIYSIN